MPLYSTGPVSMETIDKLYLEISQITKARTEREHRLASQVRWLIHHGNSMVKHLEAADIASDGWGNQVKSAEQVLEEVKL